MSAWAAVLGGLALAGGGVVAGRSIAGRSPSQAVEHLGIPLAIAPVPDPDFAIDISADGGRIAYACTEHLTCVRDRDDPVTRRVDAGRQPFLSPDGRWIAGFRAEIVKVSATGGTAVGLGAKTVLPAGGCWLADGTILFAPELSGAIHALPPGGGAPVAVTRLDTDAGDVSHRWPSALPDGRGFVYTVKSSSLATFDDATIRLHVEGSPDRTLLQGGSDARVTASWHLLTAAAGKLQATALDPRTLALLGAPVTIVSDVLTSPSTGRAAYAVSRSGDLAYVSGPPEDRLSRFGWLRPDGHVDPLPIEAPIHSASLSPRGDVVAFVRRGANDKLWVASLDEPWVRQLTFGGGNDHEIAWSPDGELIAFLSDARGERELRAVLAGGAEAPRTLRAGGTIREGGLVGVAEGVVHFVNEGAGSTAWLAPWDGSAPRRVAEMPERVFLSKLSPDGAWLAYSALSGNVYVEAFPGPGPKIVVGVGIQAPTWSPDGAFLSLQGDDFVVRRARFLPGAPPSIGAFTIVTRRADQVAEGWRGENLLVREAAPAPALQLHLVTNAFALFRRQAPHEGS